MMFAKQQSWMWTKTLAASRALGLAITLTTPARNVLNTYPSQYSINSFNAGFEPKGQAKNRGQNVEKLLLDVSGSLCVTMSLSSRRINVRKVELHLPWEQAF